MKAKKKTPIRRLSLTIFLLILIGVLIGSTAAKYIYRQELTGSVTFTAKLAENLLLQEHEVVRQDDGSYTLSTEVVETNTYFLLPGLDVPKDPYVRIEGKTPIKAYLYIEITDTTNGAIDYAVADHWEKISVAGKNVYVYHQNDNKLLDHENYPKENIPILKDDRITVSQKLLTEDKKNSAKDVLTFQAYLYEVWEADGNYASPAEVFSGNQANE